MSAHPRKLLKEITRVLEDYEIIVHGMTMGGKHPRLQISGGGKSATLIISRSPSDHRAYHNIAKSAVRALREAP